jgi:hypothetical protein
MEEQIYGSPPQQARGGTAAGAANGEAARRPPAFVVAAAALRQSPRARGPPVPTPREVEVAAAALGQREARLREWEQELQGRERRAAAERAAAERATREARQQVRRTGELRTFGSYSSLSDNIVLLSSKFIFFPCVVSVEPRFPFPFPLKGGGDGRDPRGGLAPSRGLGSGPRVRAGPPRRHRRGGRADCLPRDQGGVPGAGHRRGEGAGECGGKERVTPRWKAAAEERCYLLLASNPFLTSSDLHVIEATETKAHGSVQPLRPRVGTVWRRRVTFKNIWREDCRFKALCGAVFGPLGAWSLLQTLYICRHRVEVWSCELWGCIRCVIVESPPSLRGG